MKSISQGLPRAYSILQHLQTPVGSLVYKENRNVRKEAISKFTGRKKRARLEITDSIKQYLSSRKRVIIESSDCVEISL
jgi:hypothetical protein